MNEIKIRMILYINIYLIILVFVFLITSPQFGLGDHQIHKNTSALHVQSIVVVDFTI